MWGVKWVTDYHVSLEKSHPKKDYQLYIYIYIYVVVHSRGTTIERERNVMVKGGSVVSMWGVKWVTDYHVSLEKSHPKKDYQLYIYIYIYM